MGNLKEFLPYIVSVFSAVLSFLAAVIVSRKSNKTEMKKLKQQHEFELERMQEEYKKKEELLQQEYALRAGTQMVTSLVEKTTTAVYDAPAIKQEINKQAFNSFTHQKAKKKNGKKKK